MNEDKANKLKVVKDELPSEVAYLIGKTRKQLKGFCSKDDILNILPYLMTKAKKLGITKPQKKEVVLSALYTFVDRLLIPDDNKIELKNLITNFAPVLIDCLWRSWRKKYNFASKIFNCFKPTSSSHVD